MVKLLTDSRLPEEEHEFFHILNLFFPSIYDVKYLMKSCKNLKVYDVFLNTIDNKKARKADLSFCFIVICSACVLECLLDASIMLERLYIELIGIRICVVTVFNLAMKGALCYSYPKAGVLYLGPMNLVKQLVLRGVCAVCYEWGL